MQIPKKSKIITEVSMYFIDSSLVLSCYQMILLVVKSLGKDHVQMNL